MNLGTTRLRGRPRNKWQDEGMRRWKNGEGWQVKVQKKRGMEEAPKNGKESLHSAHANGMNEASANSCICHIFEQDELH